MIDRRTPSAVLHSAPKRIFSRNERVSVATREISPESMDIFAAGAECFCTLFVCPPCPRLLEVRVLLTWMAFSAERACALSPKPFSPRQRMQLECCRAKRGPHSALGVAEEDWHPGKALRHPAGSLTAPTQTH